MKTRPNTLIAVLSTSFALQARPDVQLVPAGTFKAWDGRPEQLKGWTLSDADGKKLAATLTAKHEKTAFVFDYEHQSMNAAENGQPAPAAGWASKFEWRDGIGLFTVDTKWNAAAKAAIEADEYRYLSPVLMYDRQTGRVNGVMNAAITNNPSLLELGSISSPAHAALCAQFPTQPNPEPDDMELLQLLIAQLGLKADATQTEALSALAEVKKKADGIAAIPQPIAAALAIKADGDISVAVTAVEALKAKAGGTDQATATIAALTAQVATLSAKVHGDELEALVAKGLKDGKLVPATEAWARQLGKDNIVSLKSYLDTVPALSITGQQTAGVKFDPNTVTLTADEIAVCSSMGQKQEDYLATKRKQAVEAAGQA